MSALSSDRPVQLVENVTPIADPGRSVSQHSP